MSGAGGRCEDIVIFSVAGVDADKIVSAAGKFGELYGIYCGDDMSLITRASAKYISGGVLLQTFVRLDILTAQQGGGEFLDDVLVDEQQRKQQME